MNFYDYVNGYRVQAAKERLIDPDNEQFTIEAVGYMAGFKTKDVFYRAFKKHASMTPLQYKRTKVG